MRKRGALSLLVLGGADELLCQDRNDRWQVHGSSCEKMKEMCQDESFGELVRRWAQFEKRDEKSSKDLVPSDL